MYSRKGYNAALGDIEKAIANGKKLVQKKKDDCVDAVLHIAKGQGCASGKWMMTVQAEHIDEVWETIARATQEGRCAPSLRLCPSITPLHTFPLFFFLLFPRITAKCAWFCSSRGLQCFACACAAQEQHLR